MARWVGQNESNGKKFLWIGLWLKNVQNMVDKQVMDKHVVDKQVIRQALEAGSEAVDKWVDRLWMLMDWQGAEVDRQMVDTRG